MLNKKIAQSIRFLIRASKDDIALELWTDDQIAGDERGINDMRIQKAISQVRKALGQGEQAPRYIQTVRGVGYRFFPEGSPQG